MPGDADKPHMAAYKYQLEKWFNPLPYLNDDELRKVDIYNPKDKLD